jgi:hypothetical protein
MKRLTAPSFGWFVSVCGAIALAFGAAAFVASGAR